MDLGFWRKLNKPTSGECAEPIMALAPMANVTDVAFRRIIAKYGKPDVLWTEFVSADGLMNKKGREALLVDLLYSEIERPIVAQLFSGNPEKMFEAAKLVKELGFDGLDINMGCPDRSIEKSGAGAALIKNPRLAREIIRAAKDGIAAACHSPFPKGSTASSQEGFKSSGLADSATSFRKGGIIPISIKTRLGYNKDILEEWLPELLAEKPAVVTIHARTRKEMSKVPAHWERVKKAVEIRDAFFSSPSLGEGDRGVVRNSLSNSPSSKEGEGKSKTLIFGNGDVKDLADARAKAKEAGADGIMLGRAIFGNPWLFATTKEGQLIKHSVSDRLGVLVEHVKLFDELLGKHKNFAIMKKHFKAYVEGFDGAKELRMKLMETENAGEVEAIISNYLSTNDILV